MLRDRITSEYAGISIKMFTKIVALSALLALSSAAPLLTDEHLLHVPLAKATFTHSAQLVDHGSTYQALPVLHTVGTAKKTITQSNQVVNHGGTAVLHTPVHYEYPRMDVAHVVSHPVVHAPVVHAPVVHAPVVSVHSPVVYSSPYLVKGGDSAVSHHSSTTHETVPVVNSLPLYYH